MSCKSIHIQIMFQLSTLVLAVLAVSVFSASVQYPTEEQAKAELQAAGMTQQSIDGLSALTQRFATRFPTVQSNKEATDKFIAEYTADAQNFMNSMPAGDQTIYNNMLKKYGLA
ncbi:DUF148 domain-containing protein [Caenorhabditis elegans]|uniref:DUF148 domain-containing protein n=1 Tax=Caenorhabditis elegans TaxID=6239 RepID=A7LPH9_CAEEL|nr:DUF148 domain-containing protein [Caenorhabditis elegans]CAO82024.1 DUF148 domain-containing protein [Caenorhabditis elegans]|eukprot:NP_001122915.1 Uncharacterized protein CELE_F14D7.14 [Caenorhabditis elegans]